MALPNDVLTEIFSYLPTKSAGRFGSLSRSWRVTLSSVHFVELHRRRANRTGELKLFFADSREEEEESFFYGWQPGGAVKKLMPSNFHQLPTPMTRPLHGLVMVRCADAGYYVCNPSTGEVLAVPDTKLPSKMIFRYLPEIPYYHFVAYGLGYCPVTHEYKVVRLFSKSTYEADDHEYSPVLCEVFVLDALSYWRPTAQQPHACIVDEENPGVFLNGCLHFLCCDGGIIAFNVTTEIFDFDSVQPLPYLVDTPTKMMTELDGCLCVCMYGDKDYADGMYHVWILRNYEQQTWEQLCRVDPSQLNSCYIAPLGIYNGDNGQMKVMFGTGTCKVFSVDVPNSGAPEILFCADEAIGCSFEDYNEPGLGLFEESLVRMGRTIEEMVSSSPITKAWFDVLKWMPTQSVAELRLVCREWRAMVEDDRFIRSHVVHANLNKSPRVMIITDYYYGQYIDLKDFTDRGLILVCVPDLVCSQPCRGLNVGSCHSRSFVCNPAMGYIERMDFENLNDDTFYAGRIGLGYDCENDEHVLVLMIYKEKNFVTREYQLECRLRYVREQEWRSLDAPPRPVANIQPTYIDGKIFWMVEPNLGPISLYCEIIAFDVEKEEFEVLPGPPCGSHGNGHVSILELQGALCVACSDKTMNVISIWMMKEVGFWLKEYHIDLEEFSLEYSSEWTTPLAIDLKDGRILLNTGWSMGYYDPKTASMETICRVGMPGDDFKFCPVVCHESLVSRFGSQPGYIVVN